MPQVQIGQSAKASVAASASATTSGVTTQDSGSMFVILALYTGTFSSVSDNKSNVYTQVGATLNSQMRVFVCRNGTGGASHTFTVSNTAPTLITCIAVEVLNSMNTLSASGEQADAASPFTSPSVTPAQNINHLLLSVLGDDSVSNPATVTPGNSFASVIEENNGALNYAGGFFQRYVAPASGSYNSTFTITGAANTGVWLLAIPEIDSASIAWTKA